MLIRKLVSLYEYPKGQWFIDFSYYEYDEFKRLVWTGDAESATIAEDELYELVKPKLKAGKTVLKRR